MSSERQSRLADRIRVLVAERLEKGLRDPRLGFVTITDVRVSGDLQHATVFYTVFGYDEERAATAAGLASATGILRREVGRNLTIRLVPTLEFVADTVPEEAAHLEDVLRAAKERDAELAKAREGATYAGEADPYRTSEPGSEADDAPRA